MASAATKSTPANLADALGRLRGVRALVAGDAMLDRYWFGEVNRISPEAPVPIVGVTDTDEQLGGAGNVARNIIALGGQCTLLSVVGDDDAGRTLTARAEHAGIDAQLIADRNAQTTIKLRVLAQKQQLLRADFESTPSDDAIKVADEKFAAQLAQCNVVVLSDYGKGNLRFAAKWIAQCRARKLPVLIDPKGGDYSRYRGASLVTPNRKEFEQAVGATVEDDDAMRKRALELIDACQLDKLLVTLSERGMALFSRSDAIYKRARAREVFDVSGAGDSVVAVMAMAAAVGLCDDDALELANTVAGIVVSKLGAATASVDEVLGGLAR